MLNPTSRLAHTKWAKRFVLQGKLGEYNDFGEPVGYRDVESNIPVNDIAGMRFYETWIFLEGEPCPRKRVNRVVFLREGLDDDGNYIGYRPMPFAIVLR